MRDDLFRLPHDGKRGSLPIYGRLLLQYQPEQWPARGCLRECVFVCMGQPACLF